jgi:hypothetical protein
MRETLVGNTLFDEFLQMNNVPGKPRAAKVAPGMIDKPKGRIWVQSHLQACFKTGVTRGDVCL